MPEQASNVISVSIEDKIQMSPIGFVHRERPNEDVKDRRIVSRVVLDARFSEGLSGIDEFSHVYVIFWLNRIKRTDNFTLKTHVLGDPNLPFVGIFATRSPIRPNPIGQTLVELIKRDDNVLWVRGLDAYDGTPVLDIKPYPDWERGDWRVVEKFRAPDWLRDINK